MATENPEILTDAFFAAALGLGLGHAADEHHLRAEEKLLELCAICPFVSLFLRVASSYRSHTFPVLKFVGKLRHKDHLRSLDGLVLEE